MLTKVRVVRFKRFADQTFDLTGGTVLLAGPNNSGKTTLLHAISAWNLAWQRWRAERGDVGGKRRISLVLDEFTALPLREMNLLWLNRHTAQRVPGAKQPKPAPIYIEITFQPGIRVAETLTIEFLYANEKCVYVRPVISPENPEPVTSIPEFAKQVSIVHVPAFSGIGTQEPRHSVGIQNKLVGEAKPGDIVRNLLVEIWRASDQSASSDPWKRLAADLQRLFQCELLPPVYSEGTQTYIVCEYRPRMQSVEKARPPKLDIASAGSGFHQVLLLLSFFYARPASVLLLDEPDAHLHFILQREIFDLLRSVALSRRCQLVVATHAEVLLDDAEPEQIYSFVGQQPRRLVKPDDKKRLRDALRRLSALDLIQADHVRAVLYVEDDSDYKLLREWSVRLEHPARRFLQFPYVVPLHGKGNLDEARQHFQSLRLAQPSLRGLCLLDRDNDTDMNRENMPPGLTLQRWGRYEIENYLLVPNALRQFVRSREPDPLFSSPDERLIEQEFAANFPKDIDYLRDLAALRDLKASDFLVELLGRTQMPLRKRELYQLAAFMRPEEIHPDVVAMLDAIAAIMPEVTPSIEANVAPADANGTDTADNFSDPDDTAIPI